MKLTGCVWALLLAAGTGLCADNPPMLTVNASGSVKIAPTALEAAVSLREKGESAQAASEALKAMREQVLAKFKELFGTTPEQVKDDDLSVFDPTQNPNYRRQQMARAGGRLKKNAGEEAKKEMVVLMQLMRVRIPLTGKDATAITLEAEAMKAKIKPEVAKFLEKKKEAKEGEEAEPDMEEMNQYGQQQGGPVFFSFYATVKENVRSDALADAIKKATESANAAAKLLNKTAELHSLGLSQDFNNQYYNQYYNEYNQYNRYGGRFNMPKSDELYSQIPAMAVQAAISATFLLK